MEFLIILAVVITVIGLIHLYLWLRLVRNTAATRRWRLAGGLALTGGAALTLLALIEVWPTNWLAWPGYVWLGLMFLLFVALLVLELPVLAAGWVWRRRLRRTSREVAPDPPPDPAREPGSGSSSGPVPGPGPSPDHNPGRRLLLRRTAAIAAGVAAAGFGGYGVASAFRTPAVKRVVVPLDRLDRRADGLRIAVIADLHIGPLYGSGQVERVVDVVNDLDADLVALVGDMVSSEVGSVRSSATPLRRMRSRYGSFFVTGNHEYYTGHEEWIEAADELGLRVLRNERVEITHGGGAIDLAGVNDREGSRYDDPPDYAAALGDRDQTRPVVLLAHQPVQVHRAAEYGVDLQLSGHTHGGQVFPFHLLVRLDQPVLSGLAEVDGTLVYVTNGAGFWGPPMRVGAAPDVTLIELHSTRGS